MRSRLVKVNTIQSEKIPILSMAVQLKDVNHQLNVCTAVNSTSNYGAGMAGVAELAGNLQQRRQALTLGFVGLKVLRARH
jgi:predicted Abi (CAAX) family protease